MKSRYQEALDKIQEVKEKRLDFLDLSFMYLGKIPSEVGQLTHLRFLNISHNYLYQIPDEIYDLPYLVELNLTYNYLSFDTFQSLSKLQHINFLYLYGNPAFEKIPDEIKYHGIDAILNYSDDITFYQNTTTLFELKLLLVGNGEVGKTTLMKKLMSNFSHKVIVGQEPTTHGINIHTWKIKSTFPAVEPFFNLKAELYEKGLDISDYYRMMAFEDLNLIYEEEEEEEEEEEYFDSYDDYKEYLDFDFKSNRPNKSKKNLIASLINGYDAEEETIKKEVKINIWDFGGQEIYHSTHQFFLTKRPIYLLVWEARKEEDYNMFDYWLNIIKYLSRNSPVIVVMNKCDVRLKDIDEFGLKKKFNNIITFTKVSCLTGEGLMQLMEMIQRNLVHLPHLADRLPKTWVNIRDNLYELNKDYITLEEYFSICKEYNLTTKKALFLSEYLHDLGSILHFIKDTMLENIVILNPEWATEAVYKLIDTKIIQISKGRFKIRDLRNIWDKEKYPTDKHHTLVRLMEKFDICFNIVSTEDYIIPELLPSAKPINFDLTSHDSINNLRFEYRYNFMPAGILSRFICRLYYLIENEIFWRNGVLLKHEETFALVINEPYDKKIRLSIFGSDKYGTLSIIRNEFENIHKTLNLEKYVDYNEMIPCICPSCISSNAGYYFKYNVVKNFERKGKRTIDCQQSTYDVSINDLLTGYDIRNTKISLLQNIIAALARLQGNYKIVNRQEDSRNSYVAGLIDNGNFISKDQTRWGQSESGLSAGELDIKIENSNRMTIGIFEGFNLSYLDKITISRHLKKIFNYDANGLKENYIVIYAETSSFIDLWNKYLNYIKDIDFDYPLIGNIKDVSDLYSPGAEIKICLSYHERNTEKSRLYHFFVNMFTK
ncbi:COR domain-containing protein [Xanthocytophaga agilis]|uniref:non-specific serine/threonine protein kinase n=1 Tax=Xanthocytophaga agilis TaxID=3048010 RepID=A0AAE3UJZ4_9BACT|nr:COR domain-containing protein [Xanthocytophaga agilis]MDJ1506837.1 COR domain-containing protein [Xanthocytophaga agilis]